MVEPGDSLAAGEGLSRLSLAFCWAALGHKFPETLRLRVTDLSTQGSNCERHGAQELSSDPNTRPVPCKNKE